MANERDLDITKDELDRIGNALKNKEFRDLLVEYCEELNDPATKRKYEEELIQLEKERGVEVTFIHPNPVYVIKTSVNEKLAFINVCTNDHVEKPNSKPSKQNANEGREWSLPHLLSPAKEDVNKTGKRCTVYDVIFHPDTLNLATKNTKFRDMVTKIACESVEKNFNICLDGANLKFPKLKYKGASHPVVIRKKIGGEPEIRSNGDENIDQLYSNLYKQLDEHYSSDHNNTKTRSVTVQNNKPKSDYATPKYTLKHRSDLDIQDFRNDSSSKLNVTVPKELIVEISLPLLKTSEDLVLDVTEKSLKLVSEKPSKYKLEITLPYTVDEDSGNAKFDVDKRKLLIILPVKRSNYCLNDLGRYDSGVDSDHSPTEVENPTLIQEIEEPSNIVHASEVFRTSTTQENTFLNPDLSYILPEYTAHSFDNIISFTLHVKNVDSNSVLKEYNNNSVQLKFLSISSGYVPVHYAVFIKLLNLNTIDDVSVETWDNNVIVQIQYESCDQLIAYLIGINEETSEEKLFEEPSNIYNQIAANSSELEAKVNVEIISNSSENLSIVLTPVAELRSEETSENELDEESVDKRSEETSENELDQIAVVKNRSFSESELSVSQSPARSILKTVARSISESSVDDYAWSSVENSIETESNIPEETEISSSMKKTVRFNDVVSKQLYRLNSSILGQRKKNQKKSKNKKRAQDRRMSESENSETEDRKEKEKTFGQKEEQKQTWEDKSEDSQIDFKSDLIFDIDI